METAIGVVIFSVQFGFAIGAYFLVPWLVKKLTIWLSRYVDVDVWHMYAAITVTFGLVSWLALLLPDGGKTPVASVLTLGFALFSSALTIASYLGYRDAMKELGN